jgi:hypothetical protein
MITPACLDVDLMIQFIKTLVFFSPHLSKILKSRIYGFLCCREHESAGQEETPDPGPRPLALSALTGQTRLL